MTDAKAAGICWGEEELTVVVVVVVVVVPAEIKKTSSWCTKLLRPDHMPSHKKKQNLSSKTCNIFTQSLQALSSSSYSSSSAVSWELVRHCDEEPVRPVMMISLKFGTPCQTDHQSSS
jgi:hypothetical protein